jgi:hypothetical protein
MLRAVPKVGGIDETLRDGELQIFNRLAIARRFCYFDTAEIPLRVSIGLF